jgi:hypothetical protein
MGPENKIIYFRVRHFLDEEPEQYKLSKIGNNLYFDDNLIQLKTRAQFTQQEEADIVEFYGDENGNVEDYNLFVMNIIWNIGHIYIDQFIPIQEDIIAYLFKQLQDNNPNITNESIFNFRPNELKYNGRQIDLPSTGSGYADWVVDEMDNLWN